MTPEQADLFTQAQRSVAAAKMLLEGGYGRKMRLDADYLVGCTASVEEAVQQIARAEQFLAFAETAVKGTA